MQLSPSGKSPAVIPASPSQGARLLLEAAEQSDAPVQHGERRLFTPPPPDESPPPRLMMAIAMTGGSGSRTNFSQPVIPTAMHASISRPAMLPPPPVGAQWRWNSTRINADGAEAGPNAVIKVNGEQNAESSAESDAGRGGSGKGKETDEATAGLEARGEVGVASAGASGVGWGGNVAKRGHCSVHVQRNVQQKKNDIFICYTVDEKNNMATMVNSMIERVKNHSTTCETAELGKTMIEDHLRSIGQPVAADYFKKNHAAHKWTLVEMNEDTVPGGGVPCQSNAIERRSLQQKVYAGWQRHRLNNFLDVLGEDLMQQSAADLSFDTKMPRGYVASLKRRDGTEYKSDMTVWSKSFFNIVKSEISNLNNHVGLNDLTWSPTWAKFPGGCLVMCSRKMRAWLMDHAEFGPHYARQQDKVKCLRKALTQQTKSGNTVCDSYIEQYRKLIENPQGYVQQHKMSFEELMDWQQSFRILQPITDEKYVHGLLQRLRASGLPLQDTECQKLFSKPDKVKDAQGLPVSPTKWVYKCSCGRYRHYLWCLHVMLRAVHDGLVKAPYCPPNLDGTPITSVKHKGSAMPSGRPAKASKGAALKK